MLFTLKGSILPVIWRRVLAMMLLAAALVLTTDHLSWMDVDLGAIPLTLMGLTLAIFLGFRNGVAYERWWEARTLWGELLVVVRNLARQATSLPDQLPAPARREFVHALAAFAHALRHLLRGSDPRADFAQWLPASEVEPLAASSNPPNRLLGKLAGICAQWRCDGHLDSMLLADMDAQLTRLSYVLGGCERIHGTPIPFAYILLLHRTVYIYCLLLPICLAGNIGWFTPLMVGVLSYTFFGLDALGEEIEDPFNRLANDLALDAICRGVEISLGELLGDAVLPPPLEPKAGVLL